MLNLQIIIRRMLKSKLNTSITIVSLSIGIACLSLIVLFVKHELNVDRFHVHHKQIYALKSDDPFVDNSYIYHSSAGSVEYMKNNFSQVDDFCRINNETPQKIVANNQVWYGDAKVIDASENFFGFFTYNLLSGNQSTVLAAKENLVISEKLALKYFGTTDVVGQPITLINRNSEDLMTISGIFRDPIERTQIKFDIVRRIDNNIVSRCYVRLASNTNVNELEKQFEAAKNTIPVIHGGTPGAYYLVSLRDAYFDQTTRDSIGEGSRNLNDLWIALIIGFLIIGIASLNYLGLVNNTLLLKSKEIAVQKINGASRSSIIYQILTENLVILLISFTISLFLVFLILPSFNTLVGGVITTYYFFQVKQLILLGAIVLLLLVGTFVFAYFRVNADATVLVMRNKVQPTLKSFSFPVFHVFQMAGSIALIVCSVIIVRQMNFITEKPIGIDREVFEIKLPRQYQNKAAVIKDELLKNSTIEFVSVAWASPVLEHWLVLLEYEQEGTKKQYSPACFTGDENYISALGIELVEGSGFSENINSNYNKCLINESFARLFKGENLVGKSLPGMEDKIVTGIVKDFHYSSLKNLIEPGFISFDQKGNHLMVKAIENQSTKAYEAIIDLWGKMIPDYPVNIETIGDRFEWMHRENRKYIRLLGSCCVISIFLSMIGLFAISFQSSRLRTKEIGIRKVNGAKNWEVMAMLNSDFVKWVAIAFVLATPIAYYAMNRWLQNFAYKTELSWWIFALAGLLAFGIALLTVSWQSWRAARRNPVEALRYE